MSAHEPPASPALHTKSGPAPRRYLGALTLSLALHLAALYGLAAMRWSPQDPPPDPPGTVVRYETYMSPDVHEAAEPSEHEAPSSASEPPGHPSETAFSPPESPGSLPPEEFRPDEPSTEPVIPAPAASDDGPAPGSVTDAPDIERPLRGMDLDEVRRDVIAESRQQRDQDQSYRQFSLDDWTGEYKAAEPAPARAAYRTWPPCPVINRAVVQFAMATLRICFQTRPRINPLADLSARYAPGLPVCETVIDGNGNEVRKCSVISNPE